MSLYDIEVTSVNGESYKLERYKGKPMLIVNTASNCGFTSQFEDLQQLNNKYADQGLVVLGFPSDQFKQELATGSAAEEACKLNYGVTFPIHEIVKVNGSDAHPLFKHLTSHSKGLLGSSVKWNFTKFLVDAEGNVVNRFAPKDKPLKFENEITNLLK